MKTKPLTKDNRSVRLIFHSPLVLYTLIFTAFFLAVISFCTQAYLLVSGSANQTLHKINRIISIDGENTIPAYFSTCLLLAAAALLGLIFLAKRKLSLPYQRYWLGLAIIFLYLSLDECIGLHEIFIGIIQRLFNRNTGVFVLAWVIPFGIFVLLFAMVYLRFLWHLPVKSRYLFVISGIIYISGTLGMEIIGGYYMQNNGWNLTLHFLLTVEETLEMIGAITFIATLLDYIHHEFPGLNIAFKAPCME